MWTIGNIVFAVFILVGCLVFGLIAGFVADEDNSAVIGALIGLVVGIALTAVFLGYTAWYHTSTASGIRDMKDYHSELDNGINREITVIASDGREIFHYEGKVDVETDHTDNYIKFEDEDGKRRMIFYGITDTVLIMEK